jgi:hypothetical protein
MTEFPKPLKHMKSGYQVYLHKVPDVGELFGEGGEGEEVA